MRTALASLVAISAFLAANSSASAAECPTPITGTYINQEYGFSFKIPPGLKGEWQSPCSLDRTTGKCICIGNHGLAFDLGGGARLGIFADYAAELDDPTLGDVLRAALDRVGSNKMDDGKHITSVNTYRLEGRLGYRIQTKFPDPKDSTSKIVHIEVIFFQNGVRCSIYADAPKGQFPKADSYFRDLLKTWRWIPRS